VVQRVVPFGDGFAGEDVRFRIREVDGEEWEWGDFAGL